MLMLALEFITWWYGPGYRRLMRAVAGRIHGLAMVFSLPLLIMTLGAPWRRIISYGGGSLGERARAVLDNLISRCVGLVVRCLVIIVAIIAIAVVALGGGLLVVLWPLSPLVAIGLVVRGLLPW
jgi:hypothetical protein